MDEQKKKLTEAEIRITEEIDAFLDQVHEDPDVTSIPLPERLEHNIRKNIHAKELEKIERAIDEELAKGEALLAAEAAQKMESTGITESSNVLEFPKETMSAEDKELIRLGKIYKKRRKLYRYLVAAAMLVFVLALGVTSIGGPEKVFETFRFIASGRNQTQTNSGDDVETIKLIKEEEVYQQIEEKYNFFPVRITYLPDEIKFLEGTIIDELQTINMIYGNGEETKITYVIRPNYSSSSFGKDVEDGLSEEVIVENEYTDICMQKYFLETGEERWSVQFEYQNVSYSMLIMDSNKAEIEKIVENLFFS